MTARPETCPLCLSPDPSLLHSSREKSIERDFFLCPECDLVFVPGRFHIGAKAERERYLTHNNDPEDKDYRGFLDRLLSPLQPYLSAGASGLDYGAGPGPALLMMLRERGFDASMYDPYFHPDSAALGRTYDFVTCTETLEHFASPRKELDTFQALLKPSSWLGVMTGMLETWDGFPDWHYHRDPTHISFYSRKTMDWISRQYRWDALFPRQNVVLFHKSVSGTAAESLARDHRQGTRGARIRMDLLKIFKDLPVGNITTIAGAGYRDGIPAKEADAGWTLGVVRRPDGDMIVVDYHANRLWRIDKEGILHTFAGDGVPGRSGDGGPAIEARLFSPHDLTQDKMGNLYLSDLGNQTYRRIDYETGIITRVAGTGKIGRGGDGGLAVNTELDTHCGIAVDDDGNLYLSSEWANNIKRVDATTGIIETFAGQDARHHPSERGSSRPYSGPGLSLGGYHGDGGPASEAAFNHPEHLAFDWNGDLYVCDNSNHRIRKIDMKTGIITTVLGNGQAASNGDGGPATEASTLMPDAIFLDVQNNLYVGEKYGFRLRKVDAETGIVTTLVGNGVPGFGQEGLHGTETQVNSCEVGIWADPDGTVLWGDCSGRLRRYDGESGIVTTLLGGTGIHDGEEATQGFLCGPGGMSVGPDGHIYLADVWNQRIRAIDPDGGVIRTVAGNGARAYGGDNGPATEAYLGNPYDVSVDSQGRVVIADTRHGHVRIVDTDGAIRGLAGSGEQWDKGDGGPAISAHLIHVLSVAHGPDGSVYIGDSAAGRIRRVDAGTGIITTVAGTGTPGYTGDGGPATAARVGAPTAICFDADGSLFFADGDNHVVRRIDSAGTITTVAGTGAEGFSPDGTRAQEATFSGPYGLAVAADGALYIADTNNDRVRRVLPPWKDGMLSTVAGSEEPGDAGDGGAATQARLNRPHGLLLYGDDVLLISDHTNNRIRAVKLQV